MGTETLYNGLIDYYKLDETTGTTAKDEVGIKNGTAVSGTTINQTGKIGKSWNFPTTGDGISVADNPDWELREGSFSFWIKPTFNTSYTTRIINKGLTSDDTSAFNFQANDGVPQRLDFTLRKPDNSANILVVIDNDVQNVMPNGAWTHIVLCWGGGGMKVYKNGTLYKTDSTYIGQGFRNTTYDWQFSGWGGTNRWLNGNLDEIGVWERMLTATEVGYLYNAGSGLAWPFISMTGTKGTKAIATDYPVTDGIIAVHTKQKGHRIGLIPSIKSLIKRKDRRFL